MATIETESTVSMIHIPTWENDLEVYEITDPIPMGNWLDVVTRPGHELEVLPYDSRIAGGRYDGGHVMMLHTEDNTFMYAVPPEVIVLLEGILPDHQYRTLLERTPRLSALAGR